MYQTIQTSIQLRPVFLPVIQRGLRTLGGCVRQVGRALLWLLDAMFTPHPIQQQINERRAQVMRHYWLM